MCFVIVTARVELHALWTPPVKFRNVSVDTMVFEIIKKKAFNFQNWVEYGRL
jgi:hypothetical protein